MSVAGNIAALRAELPAHVTLVAVSKTKPAGMIREAYEAGQRDFGENYVQELVAKQAELPEDIRWHFIGHLQSNKVKQIVPFVHLIHGVDSLRLLREISKQALKAGRQVDCLLQVYIATEESKFGMDPEECALALAESENLEGVKIRGFMGMASNTGDQAQVRREFAGLKQLFDRQRASYPHLDTLSFGMSGDYTLAVEEGSTMVRIGSTIFGARVYNQP